MKFIALALSSLLSLASMAAPILLDRDMINLGRLEQSSRSPGELTVQVQRTSVTPQEVQVKVTYDYEARICARWVQEPYYVPGYCRTVWNGRTYDRVCYPGHYEYRTYCAGYQDVTKTESRNIELNFKKAATVADGRSEEYKER